MHNNNKSNVELMAEYCDRMIKGDVSALKDLVSKEWITHAMPSILLTAFYKVTCALDGERIFFEQLTQAFSQRQLILHKNMAIDHEHIVINYTILGVHDGGYFFDVKPSGKQEKIDGTAILRFENGKIVEHWGGPTCCTVTGYVTIASGT
jgi:predicted ester cyclase